MSPRYVIIEVFDIPKYIYLGSVWISKIMQQVEEGNAENSLRKKYI